MLPKKGENFKSSKNQWFKVVVNIIFPHIKKECLVKNRVLLRAQRKEKQRRNGDDTR